MRRALGFLFGLIVLVALVGGAMWLAPRLSSLPPTQFWLALGGVALGVALIFLLGQVLVEVLFRDESKPNYDPLTVARDFNTRIVGLWTVNELSAATSAVIEDMLAVRRSGWLLLTPKDANVVIQPVSGKGQLPAEPVEFSRNNLLIRQLDLKRKPMRQSDIEDDLKYSQMPPAERDWLKGLGIEIYVPVFEAGLMTGVLVAGPKDKHRPFHPADLELLTVLATQASAAFKTANVITDLKKLNESMAELNKCIRVFA